MRLAICDDDMDFVERLKSMVEAGFAQMDASPAVSIYSSSEAFVSENPACEAVFLDIDMPSVNGFEIAENLSRSGSGTLIVFVTSHDELVYSSIKFQPFRFIRKSHLESELPEAVEALNEAVLKQMAGKKFRLQTKTGEVFLDVNTIEYIEIYGHWLRVCVNGGEVLDCYGSLSTLEAQLAPFDFVRTHKSYLVNCRYIYSIEKRRVILDDRTEILLSRYKADGVRSRFRDFIRRGI